VKGDGEFLVPNSVRLHSLDVAVERIISSWRKKSCVQKSVFENRRKKEQALAQLVGVGA
jgi:hypothetical protein